jgi:hypothetical protein
MPCPRLLRRSWEDACVAYKLMHTHRAEAVPVGEWFAQFAGVHGVVGAPAPEEEGGGQRPAK